MTNLEGIIKKQLELNEKFSLTEADQKLIRKALELMSASQDYEHNIYHAIDVVYFAHKILEKEKSFKSDNRVVILSAYWHDVGRLIQSNGHEQISANLFATVLTQNDYDKNFIKSCKEAIINHKWNAKPKIIEGTILRDADKLAWLGKNRWNECLKHKQQLNEIVSLLPKLRDILQLDVSKTIYEKQIIWLFQYIYKELKFK